MIQIPLDKEKQKQCEAYFLKYMEGILPFYASEIRGDEEPDKKAKSGISREKIIQIEKTRRKLWDKYHSLYQYLYLSKENPDYPGTYEKAMKIGVYRKQLRKLLVGVDGRMEAGERRNGLIEIIGDIGRMKNDKDLEEIFQYEKFSNSKEARQILRILGMDVCPYCNMAFTMTLEKKVRPQFDHYFPRNQYPYLAVNFYNLIPSCPRCNQFKSSHDTYSDAMIYPYDEGLGEEYAFLSYPRSGAMQYLKGRMVQEEFVLRIEPNLKKIYQNNHLASKERKAFEKRITESVKVLHLEEIYQAHVGFAAEILRNRYIFGETYIRMLQKTFPDGEFSQDAGKKILYSRDISMERWEKNILSKLVHDMDAEIMEDDTV